MTREERSANKLNISEKYIKRLIQDMSDDIRCGCEAATTSLGFVELGNRKCEVQICLQANEDEWIDDQWIDADGELPWL